MGTICVKSIPISATPTSVDFSSRLSGVGPTLYGLKSFVVTLSSTTEGSVVRTRIIFLGETPYEMKVTYDSSARTISASNVSLPTQVTYGANNLSGEPALTAYAIFPPLIPRPMLDPVQFLFDYNKTPGEICCYARFFQRIIFTLPETSSVPSITASIIPTPDGKEIEELLFRVVNKEGVRDYRQPVVRFAPVICGCAGSLRQKILDLGEGKAILGYTLYPQWN